MAWTDTNKAGTRFRGVYRDANGRKHHTAWGPRKRQALDSARDEEAKIRAGTWTDPTAGRLTFSTYFEEHWLPHRVMEERTRDFHLGNYNVALREQFGETEVRKISTGVIQRWVAQMIKDGVGARTIKGRYTTLQTTLAAKKGVSARRDGLIPVNPCDGVTLPPLDPREIDVYSVAECDSVMEALDPWWRPLPLLAAATGMRWGELLGLKVSDFSDDFAVVLIQRTIIEVAKERSGNGTRYMYKHRPKGRKPRRVALDPEAATLVRQLVKVRQLFPADRLFSMPGKNDLPLRTDDWPEGMPISRAFHRQSVWVPAHEASGVKLRRLHDLRGAHISWLLAGGADVTAVMNRVGHTQLSTTQVYVDAMKDADERALSALAVTRARARAR